MVRERKETDFVIDLAEFEFEYKLQHSVRPCLTRPLQMYRGLALGAVQGALMDPDLAVGFRDNANNFIRDLLFMEIKDIAMAAQGIIYEELDDVCHYVTELTLHVCWIILQSNPGLKESPGLYDVTLKPYKGTPIWGEQVAFTLILTYPRERDPQPLLAGPRTGKKSLEQLRHDFIYGDKPGNPYNQLTTSELRRVERQKRVCEGGMEGRLSRIIDDQNLTDAQLEQCLFRGRKSQQTGLNESIIRTRERLGELIEVVPESDTSYVEPVEPTNHDNPRTMQELVREPSGKPAKFASEAEAQRAFFNLAFTKSKW